MAPGALGRRRHRCGLRTHPAGRRAPCTARGLHQPTCVVASRLSGSRSHSVGSARRVHRNRHLPDADGRGHGHRGRLLATPFAHPAGLRRRRAHAGLGRAGPGGSAQRADPAVARGASSRGPGRGPGHGGAADRPAAPAAALGTPRTRPREPGASARPAPRRRRRAAPPTTTPSASSSTPSSSSCSSPRAGAVTSSAWTRCSTSSR
jgi:hypothetical protein